MIAPIIQEEALIRLRNNDSTLTQLDLGHNQINAAGAKALALALEKNTTLTQLDLWHNQIDNATAKKIDLLIERNKEIAVKKNESHNQIRTATRTLAQGYRDKHCLFSRLPKEINCKISGLTGNAQVHEEEQATEIAKQYFCKL